MSWLCFVVPLIMFGATLYAVKLRAETLLQLTQLQARVGACLDQYHAHKVGADDALLAIGLHLAGTDELERGRDEH